MQLAIDRNVEVEPEITRLTQMEKILEGNKWLELKSDVPTQFDPFAGLDDSSNTTPLTKDLNELF
jgi:hypothetical protein